MNKEKNRLLIVCLLIIILVIHFQGDKIARIRDDLHKKIDLLSKEKQMEHQTLVLKIKEDEGKIGVLEVLNLELDLKLKALTDLNRFEKDYMQQDIFRLMGDKGIFIFNTVKEPSDIEDTHIVGGESNLEVMGSSEDIKISVGKNQTIRRGLIRLKNLEKNFFQKTKLISVGLYLKQVADSKDSNPINLTLHLYDIRKDLSPADPKSPEDATTYLRGSSWIQAKSGVLWNTPGLWADENDMDLTVLASAVGIIRTPKDVWVKFIFSEKGLERLENILQGQAHRGWLIKSEDETIENSSVSFHSSESLNPEDRPFLEIMYTRTDSSEPISKDKGQELLQNVEIK